jgi:hypothetical protein
MTKKAVDTYLERFFEEKEIRIEHWEIEVNGMTNFIDTEFVIELIFGAPDHEKEQIANTLRKIDFANGNVNHFLKFLAEAYVKTQPTF